MGAQSQWTLSEAARLLRVPQHRLIYLCEQGVVAPDLEDARGRGSSRRFSGRNLLEFALALRLRQLLIPVSALGAILYVLRAFERNLAREIPGFRLPDGLREKGSPNLRIIVDDRQLVFFSFAVRERKGRLFGGVPLKELAARGGKRGRTLPLSEKDIGELDPAARVEIDVTRVARELEV